ncbi:MAG: acyl-CoA dehydrogenase [Deltaproteobacteria bacterium]|jgi:butyryl-CoA dehydrogenase|nr:acyl-CoA dehydrogenase [Deltaproteobacteria bacterium]
MDFKLNDEQLMIQEMARKFAKSELEPYAAEWDEEAKFPRDAVMKMGELGMMGILMPKELGGAGLDMLSYALILEEISAGCASTGVTMSVQNSLFLGPILKYGTEEQKKKYIPDWAKGKKIGAFALSEADAGSDAANQRTTAVLDGDHYILNGSKNFITSGSVADGFIVFAMTDINKGHRGISAFIVENTFDGFQVGSIEKKLGIRGSPTTEIVLDGCKVPKENLMIGEGAGFKVAMGTLDSGRVGIATQALGIAKAAFEVAAQYANVRIAFGKPIGAFQGIQWKIADMATQIDAARMLVHRAAWLKDQGKPFSREGAMAKLFASEVSMNVTKEAIQVLGGYGYCKSHPVERFYRDAKITEIYEGTSEVQRIVIARDVMKQFS